MEHRLMALKCLCVPRVLEELWPKTRVWVDTGFEHKRHDPAATLVAKALADAEARGAARTPPAELTAEVERLREDLAEMTKQRDEFMVELQGHEAGEWLDSNDGRLHTGSPPADEVAGMLQLLSQVAKFCSSVTDRADIFESIDRIEAHIKGKPAAPPQEPPARAVVVGSKWRDGFGEHARLLTVSDIGRGRTAKPPFDEYVSFAGLPGWYDPDYVREYFSHVSDPQEGERES